MPETLIKQASVERAVVRTAAEHVGFQVAWERLFVAVGHLVMADGSLQDRLDCAYIRCIAPLLKASLPGDVEAELRQIVEVLAQTNSHTNERAVRVSIAGLQDAQAKEAARRILSLFNFVARSYPISR